MPAAHTQQKFPQVPPARANYRLVNSHWFPAQPRNLPISNVKKIMTTQKPIESLLIIAWESIRFFLGETRAEKISSSVTYDVK